MTEKENNGPAAAADTATSGDKDQGQTATATAITPTDRPAEPGAEPATDEGVATADQAPANSLQFTAKARGENLEFGRHIKEVIAWRIEQGYSTSEQDAIFQMMNFAANWQKGWQFMTGREKNVYYKKS